MGLRIYFDHLSNKQELLEINRPVSKHLEMAGVLKKLNLNQRSSGQEWDDLARLNSKVAGESRFAGKQVSSGCKL